MLRFVVGSGRIGPTRRGPRAELEAEQRPREPGERIEQVRPRDTQRGSDRDGQAEARALLADPALEQAEKHAVQLLNLLERSWLLSLAWIP